MKQLTILRQYISLAIYLLLMCSCSHKQMSCDEMKENFACHEKEFSHACKIFQSIPDSITEQGIVWFYYHNDGTFGIEIDMGIETEDIIGDVKLNRSDAEYIKALQILGWTDDIVTSLISDLKTIHCNGIKTVENDNFDMEIFEDCNDYVCSSYLHIRPGNTHKYNDKQFASLSKIGRQFIIHTTSIL